MIKGLDKFREHFADYSDRFVLIGGAASDLVMADAGVDFRATKDLDIVLCLEALDTAFAEVFWGFVHAGGYQTQQRSTGKNIFYRFSLCDREAGEIGDSALDDLFALAGGFTREDGGRGFAVRDDIDVHGRTLQY